MTADLLTAADAEFTRSSAPKNNWNLFSPTGLAVAVFAIAIAVAIFVAWLIRNERRLLAATSRRFAQLEKKPNFDLKNRAKKSGENKTSAADIIK